MTQLIKKSLQGLLVLSPLALVACGGSGGGDNGTGTNSTAVSVSSVGVGSNPTSGDLRALLAQGLVDAEAIDLNDNANRLTDDRQDAFDL